MTVPFRLEVKSGPTEPLCLPASLEKDCERGDRSDRGVDAHCSEGLGEVAGVSGSILRSQILTGMLMARNEAARVQPWEMQARKDRASGGCFPKSEAASVYCFATLSIDSAPAIVESSIARLC